MYTIYGFQEMIFCDFFTEMVLFLIVSRNANKNYDLKEEREYML